MYRSTYDRGGSSSSNANNNANAAAAASKKKTMMMIVGVACVVSSVVAAVVAYLYYQKRSKSSDSSTTTTTTTSTAGGVPDGSITLVPVNVAITSSPTPTPSPSPSPAPVAPVTKKPAATTAEPAVGSCACRWMQDAKVFVCSNCSGTSGGGKQEQPQTPPTLMTGVSLESQASPGMRPSANMQKLVKTGAPALKRSPGVCATNAYLISNGALYLNETGGLLVWGKDATCWTVEQAGCGTGFYRLRSPEGLYLKALPGSNVLALVTRVSAADASSCWKM